MSNAFADQNRKTSDAHDNQPQRGSRMADATVQRGGEEAAEVGLILRHPDESLS
jgi:hypothetical protein